MSRNFFPVVMAIGVGVFTGYYTFQPTFQQMAVEKGQSPQQSQPTGLSSKETNAPSSAATDGSKPDSQGSK